MNSASKTPGVRLEIQGLRNRYGQRDVLRQAQLTIAPGKFVAIVSRSGCGKSTLLRLVAGLESANGGRILADRVILIEDGQIALDQRIDLPRPRVHGDARFAALEKRILDRVLQKPDPEPAADPHWLGVPASGLRWAI